MPGAASASSRRAPAADHGTRAVQLGATFAVLALVLVGRLFQLQVLEGEDHAAGAEEARVVTEIVPAARGRILDRRGEAIVGNRAAYNAAVVLADLECDWRARRALPFWRFSEPQFDAFVADLGLRLRAPPQGLREIVLRELLAHPGVAIRHGDVERGGLALLALARSALAPVAGADDGAPAAMLAASGLVHEDPRAAVAREATLRWGAGAELWTAAELRSAGAVVDEGFGVRFGERSATVLAAFSSLVGLALPGEDALSEDGPRLAWHLFAPGRRQQAETALARFLDQDVALVHARIDAALAQARAAPPTSDWYFAAAGDADPVSGLLPPGQTLTELALSGLPAGRERALIIQGDAPGVPGLYARLVDHLAAALGLPTGKDDAVVAALIERHAQAVRAKTCERDYRLHHLALDAGRVDAFAAGLAAKLTQAGLPATRSGIERELAQARRIADREWLGSTRHDGIALVRDIPASLARALDGVAADVPSDLAARYDGTAAALPGLVIQVEAGRQYRFPGAASHLIGSLGRISGHVDARTAAELGLDPTGWEGTSGLEYRYDAVLRGSVGKRLRQRAPGGWRTIEERSEPTVAGQDLRTELDMELQLIAEDSLNRWFELAQGMGTATDAMAQARRVGRGRAGLALIDCHTGAILALASAPGFRLDELRARWSELNDAKLFPGQPLHDHASEAAQPPGSCMKILTALAGLEHRVMTPGEEIYSPGYMAIAKNGDKVLRDHAPAGHYDLPRAIQVSSNVYFAHIGDRLGGGRLSAYFDLFGMGQKNAWDVDHQKPGRLPTPSNLARWRPALKKWLPADSWRMAIGQFLSASPLQVVTIAAAVANGGHVVRPHLVRPPGLPEVKDLNVRKDWIEVVRHGMELVTDNREGSTAKYLKLDGAGADCKVAAKTGTSEWGSSESRARGDTPDHAWLIGYAPAERPTVAFAIFIHSGTSGGRACSPVAKRVLEAYFTRYGRGGHAAPAKE